VVLPTTEIIEPNKLRKPKGFFYFVVKVKRFTLLKIYELSYQIASF